MKRGTALIAACYITIYLVWGSTYFFIKWSVETIPPLYVLAVRWTIGGVLLLGFSIARRTLRSLPSWRELAAAAASGILFLLVGNGLITLAEKEVDSYVAALLASSAPILVAILDRLVIRKTLSPTRILGVVSGFSGVALMLYNGRSLAASFSPAVLLCVAGVVSWSLATSLGHRFPVSKDNTVNSGFQMLFIGLASLFGSWIFNAPPREFIAGISARSAVGVLYLGVIGSLAFSAYTYLISFEPAERVVSYALVNPLIALFLGLALGSETPTPYLFLGVPLILCGLGFTFYGERLAAWFRRERGREARGD